ncbi:hypothetical protein F444_04548 [Phytophthora nicotianae P1976]|uniref:Secreted protein n=1 Tax=Phytophthora nicotianae P1976 TaxID=1317066 RepID=A0A081AQB6_PHYNI|nr:hypothetical protein F444_04548 [Phytophthora nicotianae P1976]
MLVWRRSLEILLLVRQSTCISELLLVLSSGFTRHQMRTAASHFSRSRFVTSRRLMQTQLRSGLPGLL